MKTKNYIYKNDISEENEVFIFNSKREVLDYITQNGLDYCDIELYSIVNDNRIILVSDTGIYKGSINSYCCDDLFIPSDIYHMDLSTLLDKIYDLDIENITNKTIRELINEYIKEYYYEVNEITINDINC